MSREAVVSALTAPDLSGVVDLVVWVEDGVAHAANHLGSVRLHPDGSHEVLAGADPVASEDPMAFLPYESELAAPGPSEGSAHDVDGQLPHHDGGVRRGGGAAQAVFPFPR